MMARVRRPLDHWLIAACTATAAVLVHDLRFLATPAFALVLTLGLGFALRGARLSVVLQWSVCTAALLALFGGQELLDGHGGGLLGAEGVVAALPLAALFGAALTALLRRGRATISAFAWALRHRVLARLPRPARGFSRPAADAVLPRRPILARRGAGRAPPLTACS
jgi:hypothetical protein